jgi:hypothetical protein
MNPNLRDEFEEREPAIIHIRARARTDATIEHLDFIIISDARDQECEWSSERRMLTDLTLVSASRTRSQSAPNATAVVSERMRAPIQGPCKTKPPNNRYKTKAKITATRNRTIMHM